MQYVPPKWISPIPQGCHGSSIVQKKYWKVVSDYVRIRDYFLYATCISCSRRFSSWQEGQAGHYKAWGSCRGYSKYDTKNIFLQCTICNSSGSVQFVSKKDSNVTGGNFKDAIRARHGKKRIDFIASLDSYPTEKMEDHIIVDKIELLIILMKNLPEKPEYFNSVILKLNAHNENN